MARCPECQSLRVVVVIGSIRRAFCTACGTRWIQDGMMAKDVQAFGQLRRPRPIRGTFGTNPGA